MGFHDTLTFEKPVPEFGIEPETVFETKNLHQVGDQYVVTAEGRLLWRLYRYKPRLYLYQADRDAAPASELRTSPTPVLTEEKFVDYHGDLLLVSREGERLELVARFTRGRLEWIRPSEEYPEDNRQLLLEQGAR